MQSDLWSLGCILYALLTGTPPFECPNVQDTLLKIKKGKFKLPGNMSAEVQDLVSGLLDANPDNRIGIEEVLSHDFLAPVRDQLGLPKLQVSPKKEDSPRETDKELGDLLGFVTLDPNENSSFKEEAKKAVKEDALSHLKRSGSASRL